MSSNGDEISKAAEALYQEINKGTEDTPNYAKFMTYALRERNQSLVTSLLHHGDKFTSQAEVTKLLQNYLETQQQENLQAGLENVIEILNQQAPETTKGREPSKTPLKRTTLLEPKK